jgi:hypothetical protein
VALSLSLSLPIHTRSNFCSPTLSLKISPGLATPRYRQISLLKTFKIKSHISELAQLLMNLCSEIDGYQNMQIDIKRSANKILQNTSDHLQRLKARSDEHTQ